MASLIEKTYRDKHGRKKLSNFQAEFHDSRRHPKRKRVSLGTRNRSAAELKLKKMELDFAAGTYDPWTDGSRQKLTYEQAKSRFLKRLRRLGREEVTILNYERLLDALGETLPHNLLLSDVSPRQLERYLDGCDINATSFKTYLRHFHGFFKWAVEKGHIEQSPISDDLKVIASSGRSDPLPSFYSQEQFERLCEHADQKASAYGKRIKNPTWISGYIRALFYLGCRPKELASVEWRDIDLDSGFILFRRTKNKTQRRVFMPATLRERIEEMAERPHVPDDPVFRSATGLPLSKEIRKNLSRRVKEYARKLGLPDDIKALYGLRHGHVTHHLQKGTPAAVVSNIVGHKRIEQLNTYHHAVPENQAIWQQQAFGEVVDLAGEIEALRAENEALQAENEALREENAALKSERQAA